MLQFQCPSLVLENIVSALFIVKCERVQFVFSPVSLYELL